MGCASIFLLADCSFKIHRKRNRKTIKFGTLIEDENDAWLVEGNISSWYESAYFCTLSFET